MTLDLILLFDCLSYFFRTCFAYYTSVALLTITNKWTWIFIGLTLISLLADLKTTKLSSNATLSKGIELADRV